MKEDYPYQSWTYKQLVPCASDDLNRKPRNLYVVFRLNEQGRLGSIFLHLGKAGCDDTSYLKPIAQLMSKALSAGTPPEELFALLSGHTTGNIVFRPQGEPSVTSVVDGIAHAWCKFKPIYDKHIADNPPNMTIEPEDDNDRGQDSK